jgi:hypothetical protein
MFIFALISEPYEESRSRKIHLNACDIFDVIVIWTYTKHFKAHCVCFHVVSYASLCYGVMIYELSYTRA